VEATVADTGPGLAPEAMAHLFEPFFTTKPVGTGLGLAIARELAQGHGGDLTLVETGPTGTIFELRLPRA
jgi:signal transduction histidine kinase